MGTASRRGLWLLPIAAILTGLPWLAFFDLKPGGEGSDSHEEAVRAISLTNQLAGYAYITGFICLLVGMIALALYIASRRGSSWAAPALVLDAVAVALIMPVQGVVGLGDPIVASYYLSGHSDVGPLFIQLSGGSFAPQINAWVIATILIALAGAVASGVASWRTGAGRWSGVLVAAGFVLTVAITPLVSWVGAALLVGAGSWIAWHANRVEAASANPARAESEGDRVAQA
jgi:hypothetical protein